MQKRTLLIALFATCLLSIASPASATDVEVDGDAYLVTGGVYHADIYPYDRVEAAHCINCYWKIVVICSSWTDDAHGSCPYLRLRCPATMRLAEVNRANETSRPPTTSPLWRWMGYTCLSETPASTKVIEQTITDEWRVRVPSLIVTTNPPHTTLLHFPTQINISNGLVVAPTDRLIGGNKVTITASARRSFSCQDACVYASSTTRFTAAGHRSFQVSLQWDGYYSVEGLPLAQIPGPPIAQQVVIPIDVIAIKRHIIANYRR